MREGEVQISRREREEKERRSLILEAAERLFAEKGLNDTSMAEIAREAEFGVGTLYKYFEDKNTLIRTLVKSRMDEHFSALETALLSEGPPERIVERAVGVYLDSVKARSRFFKFFMTNFHPGVADSGGPVDVAFLCERRERIIALSTSVFKRGTDEGRFAQIEADALTGALFGMMMSFHFHGECHLAGEWNAEDFKKKILTIFFHPILLVDAREDNHEG